VVRGLILQRLTSEPLKIEFLQSQQSVLLKRV